MPNIPPVIDRIQTLRREIAASRSLLVGVSGIDASGKGYTTGRIVEALEARGLHSVGINLDAWMNLPEVRFSNDRPAEHFYHQGFRFDELFDRLVLPLKQARSIELDAQIVKEPSPVYHSHRYEFHDVDVVVLEGIYLFQEAFRPHFDLAVWVECSFETALERALVRGQEGLPPAETIDAFETIYFPAERYHFERDDPKASADMILMNDPRLDRMVPTE